MKKFICIYCGKEKDISESSNEHVIPRYLYGRLIIREVCETCNNSVGKIIEPCFPKFVKHAKYLRTGIIETEAKTTIDGIEIEGIARVIEQRTGERPYKLDSFLDKNNNQLKEKVTSIEFLAHEFNLEDLTKNLMPGIFKICFSALHYFLNYEDNSRNYLDFVDCPELGGMRLFFNPKAKIRPGQNFNAIQFQHLGFSSWKNIRDKWNTPEIRRNYIEIKNKKHDTEFIIVLLSDWAWKVIIKNFNIPKNEFIYEDLLPKLNKLFVEDRERRSEMISKQYGMHIPNRINMNIAFKK